MYIFLSIDSLKVIDSLKSVINNISNNYRSVEFYNSIYVGIIGSLIASFIFIFFLLILFKPRIKISPFICKDYLPDEPFPNPEYYFIKVVNHSFFNAYQLTASLQKKKAYPTPPIDMKNYRLTPIEEGLYCDKLNFLPSYKPKWLRREAKHCFRFRSKSELHNIIGIESQVVVFEIIATHELTGISKVFVQEYSHQSQIKVGQFTYGTKFGVLGQKT